MIDNVGLYAVRKLKDRKKKHPTRAKSQILLRYYSSSQSKICDFAFPRARRGAFYSPELGWT
jgi:hypothetical protein